MTVAPSGEQFEIVAGDHRATLVEVGGGVAICDPHSITGKAQSMAEDYGDPAGPTPVRAQAAIEQARAQLLTGRGPGATPQEITHHTRARSRLGGQPTAQQRDQVAKYTGLARGDPDALALHAADRADALGATVEVLCQRLTPSSLGAALRLALAAATLGALLIAAAILRHNHRRHGR